MQSNRNISRFIETLDTLNKNGKDIPGLILSRPGFGKTSTIELWSKYKDYNCYTLIPSRYSADDIVGLQSMVNGKLNRMTPSWFDNLCEIAKNGKRNILFIDEITTCDPYIQGPLLDLIFSHSLGEGNYLPENTFIIAAGNYSSDLNNMFRLTAPIVNRFEILNLSSEDYDIYELLDFDFSTLNTREKIGEYLGVENDNSTDYSFSKFKEWVKSSREIQFGKVEVTEDDEIGLLGFTSVRSVSFTMSFVETYMAKYNDTLWTRIAGDTLGISKKREVPLRNVLASVEAEFIGDSIDERTITEVCDDILKKRSISKTDCSTLEYLLKSTPWNEITEGDYNKFITVAKMFNNNESVIHLTNLMRNKVVNESKVSEY